MKKKIYANSNVQVNKKMTGLHRVGLFFAGCFFGFLALTAAGSNSSEASTWFVIFGAFALGGFVGAFRGWQTV